MSGMATLALAAGLILVEAELREVTQTVVPAGSVSTAQARIRPMGAPLRLSPGGTGRWRLDSGPDGDPAAAAPPATIVLRLQAPRAPGHAPQVSPEAAILEGSASRRRWELQVRLLSVDRAEARVALAGQHDSATGEAAWQAEQRLRWDHWTVVAREHPGSAPPAGSWSTQALAEIKEWQMRVRKVHP